MSRVDLEIQTAAASDLRAEIADVAKVRPAEDLDLLKVLLRGVEQKNPWCLTTADRIGPRGWRLTEAEKLTLKRMRDEGRGPMPVGTSRGRGGISALQPKGGYRPRRKAEDE